MNCSGVPLTALFSIEAGGQVTSSRRAIEFRLLPPVRTFDASGTGLESSGEEMPDGGDKLFDMRLGNERARPGLQRSLSI